MAILVLPRSAPTAEGIDPAGVDGLTVVRRGTMVIGRLGAPA